MLTCQKSLFSLPEEVIYLNCAYMSPMLKSVEEAGIIGIQQKRNPTTVFPEHFFDPPNQVREEFSRLIDNPEPERICLIPSVSYGMGIVANNLSLSAGDNILVPEAQFPSNIYPWLSLAERSGSTLIRIPSPDTVLDRGTRWNEAILEAINPQTRLVALGHIHWTDGTLFDLKAIRKRTLEVGALLVIDGTQSIGALPFSVQEIAPDALIVGGYKCLMGPYSLGLAYLGSHYDSGIPLEENWKNRKDSHKFANLVQYQPEYQAHAIRYDVGESSNFILLPMLQEAIRQVNKWGPSHIQAYCRNLTLEPLHALQHLGFSVEDDQARASHLFGIRLPHGLSLDKLKAEFEKDRIFVSIRGDAIRVSPNVYNTPDDLEKLVAACKRSLA